MKLLAPMMKSRAASRAASRAVAGAITGVILALLMSATASLAEAQVSPHTEVASAFDDGDAIDVHVTLDYGFSIERAEIKREWNRDFENNPVMESDPLPVVKDLLLSGSRHVLIPRLELGLFTDLSFSVALPVVIARSRSLDFDDRAGDTVNRINSTTLVDGLLGNDGFDADDPATSFPDGSTIFRSPSRSGLDQVHLGLAWAPMNQQRDDTKPTWKLGAEVRLAIGSPMKLDRADPGSETSVGRGVHEMRVWTSLAKRRGWAEPFFEVWWLTPVGTASDSPFEGVGFGQNRFDSQQRAGTRFGVHAIAWERPETGSRVSFDFSGRFEAAFEGRAYSPMWEVFQFAGDADADADGPLVLDGDPTTDGQQALSHPGVTNIENYLRFGGRLGFEAGLGQRVRFGAAIELMAAQDHAITFADAGQDGDDDGNAVTPGSDEVNPTHVPLIDQVGGRYRVEEAIDFLVLIDTRVLF